MTSTAVLQAALRTRISEWRDGRGRERKQSGPHPMAHVDPDRCYEWMRADCAALKASRQSREDAVVATITQVSSAALLGIPGLLFGAKTPLPALAKAPLLYSGILLFLLTVFAALLEQYLSSVAYRRQ